MITTEFHLVRLHLLGVYRLPLGNSRIPIYIEA